MVSYQNCNIFTIILSKHFTDDSRGWGAHLWRTFSSSDPSTDSTMALKTDNLMALILAG